MSAMIIGAATMSVDQARKVAGNRLARLAQSCDPCQEVIKTVDREGLAAALGADEVRKLIADRGNEAFLVDGVAAAFAKRLHEWNVNDGWPERLGQMVEQHAWRTLYEPTPPPFPTGFLAACERAIA